MADKTSLQESAQALFCSLADFVGATKVKSVLDEKKYPTYGIFKKYWDENHPTSKIQDSFKKFTDTDVTLPMMEEFLMNNPDWYISSVLIAKKLIVEIDDISRNFTKIKRPTWSSIFYVRGDETVMKNIALLFKEANNNQKKLNSTEGSSKNIIFGDINKWSPADIYFASPKVKKEIADMVKNIKGLSFVGLNSFVASSIEEGQLLPLSLKKQTQQVVIKKVNFSRTQELKEIKKLKSYGTSDWKPRTKSNPKVARDLKLYISNDKKDFIKVLHDSGTGNLKANFESKSMEARGGSIGSAKIFADVLSIIDVSFANTWLNTFTKANNEWKKEVDKLGPKPPKDTKAGDIYRDVRGELSATYVTNKVIPPLLKWFGDDDKADKFVRLSYEYITSRSQKSSQFVIAK